MSELLLGCGPKSNWVRRLSCGRGDQWTKLVTLDINPAHEPDVVWDLNKLPLPFEDNQFDEVHAVHVLEHFGAQGDWKSFFDFFSEVWRILKPGGCFAGITPMPNSPWAWADPGHVRILTANTMVFLVQPSYSRQIGVTQMTDYREYYKADFDLMFSDDSDFESRFILMAVKPSRVYQPAPVIPPHLRAVNLPEIKADPSVQL